MAKNNALNCTGRLTIQSESFIFRLSLQPRKAKPMNSSKNVIATEGTFAGMVIGSVSYNEFRDGWTFLPMYQAKPSRKFHPSPDAAVKGRVKNYRLEDRS